MFVGECDYAKLCSIDNVLMNSYSIIKRKIIGYSAVGREIISYTAGGESGVLMCGAFHGMERITAMMLLKFLTQLCERCICDRSFLDRLNTSGVTIVPMVNPDSVEISLHGANTAGAYSDTVKRILKHSNVPHTKWQANARGVDINHNFNAGFKVLRETEIKSGYILPSNTRYGGGFPESESETRAITNLCRKKGFKTAVALHTQGREIYYDYGDNTPKCSIDMANAMAKASGYTVSQPSGIAVGGGFKDWFIERFCAPAFTIEAGIGQNPLSPDIFDAEYPRVEKMLWYLVEQFLIQ